MLDIITIISGFSQLLQLLVVRHYEQLALLFSTTYNFTLPLVLKVQSLQFVSVIFPILSKKTI